MSSNYVKYEQKESEYENREKELYAEIKKLNDDIAVKNKKIYDLQYKYEDTKKSTSGLKVEQEIMWQGMTFWEIVNKYKFYKARYERLKTRLEIVEKKVSALYKKPCEGKLAH